MQENIKEEWRDVPNFENYQVSTLGNVISKNYKRSGKSHLLKPSLLPNGYLNTSLGLSGKIVKKRTHRVVAEIFIPNPNNKPFINHINGIKTDNRVENLEWCTYSENMKHAYDIGLMSTNRRVIVIRKTSMGEQEFNTQVAASLYMEKDKSYISDRFSKNLPRENKKYRWEFL